MEFKIGKQYPVKCAEIETDDERVYYIPVFEHLHADAQFGFALNHYHIDGRFYLHPPMQHLLNVVDGHTAAVIVPELAKTYSFIGIVEKIVMCVRLTTGLLIPDNPTEKQLPKIELYENWYKSFIGKSCKGKKCPHLGTDMQEKNGYLVCPMHDIYADPTSLKVIYKPKTL
ncbi:hypothetical protein DIU31_006030 [Mucilaginibacter rubeus]|uniref:Uncharacterized protein n=1 Tax=Mucilaginibacter rubeus TaxID=2027860 RepID=A0AAE6JCC9_9SPHI|nr:MULTISPECIES: hypothetical protein [Mucilaginibacter]QEM03099.1 hypothetical protein DIU31_006030 [Mucilaginibacter rubeus]QEM15717.1 hypothetical protein DIU38_006100 [Mucilaginibacter gossypii]QTE41543.1 hypothetical protein J3L19_21680 [Mucilaginibacter rubeus]QTE48149.1 hypothetical protein J3L21_21680 [Mucilaginibacter rubeus]QTE59540.1 hypothetical protein J3L23_13325 [Mucilaginibacter rubeus]